VHSVFSFIEDHGIWAFKYFIGHFHRGKPKLLVDIFSHSGLEIVESGQAVHEERAFTGLLHHIGVHLVGFEQFDTLFPDAIRFAHGNPNVGVNHISAFYALGYIVGNGDFRSGFFGYFFAFIQQLLFREEGLGADLRKSIPSWQRRSSGLATLLRPSPA
jgi:hypothetical protein